MIGRLWICLACLASAQLPPAAAAEAVRWRVNSVLHPQLFGESGRIFADEVDRMTDGDFRVDIHDQLVLDVDAFEALQTGLVDAVWGSPGHHHREEPSLTIFGGFPFGPDPEAFNDWMTQGGGSAALNGIYARHGLRSIYCGALPAEGGGWFRKPVDSLGDLDGLAMRSFGYGAQTLRNLGVTTFELPSRDILPAFETGLIDAAEFAMPSIDAELGIAGAAPYLYLPGWQQPATSLELLVLERSWLALSPDFQAAITTACQVTRHWALDVAAARQQQAIGTFRAQGVQVLTWPDTLLAALEASWAQVIAAEVARDPELGVAWRNYLQFRHQGNPPSQDGGGD